MNIVHQMNLPRSVWEEFHHRLNHYDPVRQEKVNAFLRENHDVRIRRERDRDVVESDWLNTDAILAALGAGDPDEAAAVRNIEFDIQIVGYFDAADLRGYVERIAEDDTYHDITFGSEQEYATTDAVLCVGAAA